MNQPTTIYKVATWILDKKKAPPKREELSIFF